MNNTPNKLNKTVIITCLVLLVLLSLFNIIDQNKNKISMDLQFTIYTENTMIIVFARPWDFGISICDNFGGYKALSLSNGFFSRPYLIGNDQQ